MRQFYLTLLTLLLSTIGFAQSFCGFDTVHQRLLRTNSEYAKALDANEDKIRQYIKNNPPSTNSRRSAAIYTIPIVVHVMRPYAEDIVGPDNPSDDQIVETINYLNNVYNGNLSGGYGVGDLQIQFEFVKRRPDCAATNGINRFDASLLPDYQKNGVAVNGSNNGCPDPILKSNQWNPKDYLNIWVVNKINGSTESIAGYGELPFVDPAIDGVVILSKLMKPYISTLPHEMGHSLNLYHVFEGGGLLSCPPNNPNTCNDDGDRVCDTDPVRESIPESNPRTGINPCTNTLYKNDNTEWNYMGYTNKRYIFTPGQKQRMFAAMSLPSRSSLVILANPVFKSCPDLIVQNAQAPTTITIGIPTTVSCRNKNEGMTTAGSSYTAIWLSKNQTFERATDINLSDIAVPALTDGQTSATLSKQITIPSGTSPGSWYIMFGADATEQVNESNEGNNQTFVPITVQSASNCTPPSTPTSLSPGNTSLPGQTIYTPTPQLNWATSSNATTYIVHISKEPYGASNFVYTSACVTAPFSVPSGVLQNGVNYRWDVEAYTSCGSSCKAISNDAYFTVNANTTCSAPANNSCPTAQLLTVSSTCNFINGTSCGATNSNFGTSCNNENADDDVFYKFTATTTSTTIKVQGLGDYNPVFQVAQGPCGGSMSLITCINSTGAGGLEQTTISTTTGTDYYIRVWHQGTGWGTNGNFQICVSQSNSAQPNLTKFTDALQIASNSITLNITVQNNGTAASTQTTIGYYLSTSPTFTNLDYSLGTTALPALGTGATYNSNPTFNLCGVGIPNGTYYVGYFIDNPNSVTESNEDDNLWHWGSAPITINCCNNLSAPIATTPTNIGATSFTANWNTLTGASEYFLDISTHPDFTDFYMQNQSIGNALSFNVTNLTCGTLYYYRVRAKNSCGSISGNSETMEAQPRVVSPTALYGSNSSPGFALTGTQIAALTFTNNGGASFSGLIARYPFTNSFIDVNCATNSPLYSTSLQKGMLYSWQGTAFSNNDCSGCYSLPSNTKYFHLPPEITFNNQVPASPISICIGSSITLSTTIEYPGGGATVNYRWMNGSNMYQQGPNLTSIQVTTPGTYSLIIDYSGSTMIPGVVSTTASNSIQVTNQCTVTFSGKVFLQAAYNSGIGTMNTALNSLGILQTYANSSTV